MAESLSVKEPALASDKTKDTEKANPKDTAEEAKPKGAVKEKPQDAPSSDAGGGTEGGAESGPDGDGTGTRRKSWKNKRGNGGGNRGGGGRGKSWRNPPYYGQGGGGYYQGNWKQHRQQYDHDGGQQAGPRLDARNARAEDLQAASLAQKDDRVISFDCRLRPKSELTGWLRYYKPSVIKRSQGVGYLAVLSANCTSIVEEKLACGSEETQAKRVDLLRDWEYLTSDPTSKIDYSTMRALANKHDIRGGKWLFQARCHDVDSTWMFLSSAVASEENPMPCVAAKITPVNDVENVRGGKFHMVHVYTRDFTDEENVFEVEKALRKIPIKQYLTYKPDLFSALGIYRNNKYGLRPTIYSSSWHSMSGESEIESVFDMDWSYVGGQGDTRDKPKETAAAAFCKEELEKIVDRIIDVKLEELDSANNSDDVSQKQDNNSDDVSKKQENNSDDVSKKQESGEISEKDVSKDESKAVAQVNKVKDTVEAGGKPSGQDVSIEQAPSEVVDEDADAKIRAVVEEVGASLQALKTDQGSKVAGKEAQEGAAAVVATEEERDIQFYNKIGGNIKNFIIETIQSGMTGHNDDEKFNKVLADIGVCKSRHAASFSERSQNLVKNTQDKQEEKEVKADEEEKVESSQAASATVADKKVQEKADAKASESESSTGDGNDDDTDDTLTDTGESDKNAVSSDEEKQDESTESSSEDTDTNNNSAVDKTEPKA